MLFSRLVRTVQSGLKSLLLHKLRSGLTMLGIVFGVFSVIAMLAIGEGASKQAQQQIVALGATNIIARTIKPVEGSSNDSSGGGTPRYGLLRSDLKRLQKISTVVNAIPIRELNREARYLKRTIQGRLVGCTPDYLELNQLKILKGRFLSDSDLAARANVVVLAHDVAQTLFPIEDPLENKAVQIDNVYYNVIGVTQQRTASAAIGGSLAAQEFDKDFYIPIDTFRARLGDQIFTPKQSGSDSEYVELNQITLAVGDVKEVISTADVVRGTLEKYHPQKDFAVVVPLELLKQAEQLRQIFNVVLGSIAAISLVVGGIGIMNIMLATVTERTREIGIRRALGARQRDIIEQFLTETVVLSGSGGVLGIGLGLITPWAFKALRWFAVNFVIDAKTMSETGRMFQELEPTVAVWSLPLAFGISVGIGIIFGLYPARAAARLDPIEALRHE